MNEKKEIQLAWLKTQINNRVDEKFRKGAEEHNQDLDELNLVEEAAWEQIDGLIYLLLEIKKRND